MYNPTELSADDRARLTAALKSVMGDTYALYVKTHGYHWNVTGPRFKSLHEMFMEQYTELWTALDEIAERIRTLGEFAPGSTEQILENATIKPDNSQPDADSMVENLAKGHDMLSTTLKKALDVADEIGDDVTVDLFTQRMTVSQKTAWMLRSSL
ncbi:Dps family protein [Ponticaulis sp.]|jgi:starvation-inducible DNA-binding protein|uniref:Dps family protein n=1 Tax=Ponticaulis sp. TaxID=2020902 RepID=UPI000B655AFD|nr:Dps family protein [Ponticaulis sp.]RPG17410.1 MAG: DNA starvation/stationary phase protection protein [Hyphomonadaceae bacterium TMED125]HBH89587.1 DNA starvation/stationary phase protection protein [Hyphomonadaceae bacterium]MAF56510.1 DNA starvation/stationary phase protection protein [Ponticaulis sp.]MAJ08706.1 DNA starvation/stationary phase protection protein [Ponticaulis sp.]MBN06037.1 DNA starvation/stationary phase protection protein [Ponticaulis sp.]|tara:strand:- start:90 stop:554 length:465 start_codon:yes stop_codon:yes gene_type:complete